MPIAVADVIERLSDLPPFPKVTAKLLTLLNDPDVTIDEFSDIISADPSLVLKTIHLANSPFYMVAERIESVRRAIFVLGLQTIKTIATATAIHKGIASYTPSPDVFDFKAFWKHSYATAIAAGKLAKSNVREEKDKLYLTGLIHDIGKVILAYHWPESWKQFLARIQLSKERLEVVEPQLFTVTHDQIAATLCRNWQFPEDIIVMIQFHHSPEDAPENYLNACRMLYHADIIASLQGFAYPVQYEPQIAATELDPLLEIVGELETEVEYQLESFCT